MPSNHVKARLGPGSSLRKFKSKPLHQMSASAEGSVARKRPASSAPSSSPKKRQGVLREPISTFDKKVSLSALQREADRVGFDANAYLTNGYVVLENQVLTSTEMREALAAAKRVRESSCSSDNAGEFVFLRGTSTPDKLLLFSLLNKYVPFLHQLLSGIRLPRSDMGPYSHHNQVQVAIKRPGFEGYDKLENMANPCVGHIDQTASKQTDGMKTANYSVLLGIVLEGDTGSRDDAGNLYVAAKSHNELAAAFKRINGAVVPWHLGIVNHYLREEPPRMHAVRAKPGQAILMHHQTVHGVGPNCTDTPRVNVYFRVTAQGRPKGKQIYYPEAMWEPVLETPLLRQCADSQRG